MANTLVAQGGDLQPGAFATHIWKHTVREGVYVFKVHPMDNQVNPAREKRAQIRNLTTIVKGGHQMIGSGTVDEDETTYFEVHNTGTFPFAYNVWLAYIG